MSKTAIILSFFSPCEYALPRKHFQDSIARLVNQKAEVIAVQHILPWQQPVQVPPEVNFRWYMSTSLMFYKENLWNLAAGMTDADNLIFLDSDVLLGPVDWLRKCEVALRHHDIIQPFEFCRWLDKDGEPEKSGKDSAAKALKKGLQPDARKYHAGFGWGMTREAFNKLGGFFDLNVAGSGDTALTLALTPEESGKGLFAWFVKKQDASLSWKKYRENALQQNLKIGYAEGVTASHQWHGEMKNRNYCDRDQLFVRKDDGEHPAHRREDGLLVWDDPKTHNVGPAEYFAARREDG